MFRFGFDVYERDYKKLRQTIQAPHLHPTIKAETVANANVFASCKYNRQFQYEIILNKMGIVIVK